MENTRPNILFITTDQHRFDCLGINGNTQIKTPNIDALAKSGVNFSNAFVQNTVCVPSRACMQTGRYTHQHGVTYMETVVDDTPGLPDWELTFMERLQESGYYTGAAGKMHMYPEKGFDWHNLTGGKGQRWLYAEGDPLGPGPLGPKYAAWLENKRKGAYEELYQERRAQNSYKKLGVMDIPLSNEEYIETWIADESINFINDRAGQDQPFFLWTGFCGPHGPFDPPEPYKSMYSPDEVPLPQELPEWPSWRESIDEKLMRKCIAYYWGMVTCIDDHIGRIVDSLKRKGIFDDTLIIFTSDHGEMLGERGKWGKCVFYDTTLRVPTWVKPPANTKFVSRTASEITEAMNVAPTILDYANVPIPENMTAQSWRPLIEGENKGMDAILSEYVTNDKKEWSKCIRTATHKYIKFFNSGKEEFYDLENDSFEQFNLAETGSQKEKMLELKDAMLQRLAQTEPMNNY